MKHNKIVYEAAVIRRIGGLEKYKPFLVTPNCVIRRIGGLENASLTYPFCDSHYPPCRRVEFFSCEYLIRIRQ